MRLDSMLTIGNASLLLLLAGCCNSCNPCEGDDTALDTEPIEVDTDVNDDTGTDTEIKGVHGTVNGTVTVTLYSYDESGNIIYTAWEDTCFGDTFPYGDIFVTAYSTDEKTGAENYYADDTLADPATNGALNTFSFDVDTDQVGEVHLYAVLDKWFNRVIEPSDPVGIYADPIVLQDGEIVNDVNIEILTQYWCGSEGGSGGSCPDCPPSWGSSGSCYYWDGTQWVYNDEVCGGPGCQDGTVTVGGDLQVAVPYNGVGDVGTFLLYPGTDAVWWVRPDIAVTTTPDGADGDWGYTYCKNSGTYVARGVWDDNANGLYDPSDTWGQTVDADGAAVGSITFGDTDEEVTMLIPVGGSDFGLVPFVRVFGDIRRLDDSWDALLVDYPDAHIYVVGGKYVGEMEILVSTLEDAYDYDVFGPEQLAGAEQLDYTLLAPANTSMYLYAAADLDNDGMIDGNSEGWACGGEDDCWMSTGESNIYGQSMGMDFSFLDDTAIP